MPLWSLRSRALAVALAAALAAPAAAAAGETDETDGADDESAVESAAREHYERGIEFYDEGDLSAALVEFKEAYRLRPSYRLKYNIGQVYAALGQDADAHRNLEEYLEEGGDEIDEVRRHRVRGDLEELAERVGRLAVTGGPDRARLVVDGVKRGTLPLEEPLLLDVGQRTVEIESGGRVVRTRTVEVAAGRTATLDVGSAEPASPAPSADEPPARLSGKGVAGIVGAGVGLVVVGVGAGFGGRALASEDDLAGDCEGADCAPYTRAAVDDYRRDRLAADVMFGVGGALVAAGAALLVWDLLDDGDADPGPVDVSLETAARPGGGALVVEGRF